jgi:hypothetical protein
VLSAFFTGLRDGKLLGARTVSGEILMPPREYDQRGHDVVDLVEVAEIGTLQAFTTGNNCFGLVLLDGTHTAMIHHLDVAPSVCQVGLRVRVRWAPQRHGTMADIEAFEAAP